MIDRQTFYSPVPIVDKKELDDYDKLTARYEKLITPTGLKKAGEKIIEKIPTQIKNIGDNVTKTLTEQEIYDQMMKLLGQGFKTIEEQAAKFSISEDSILKKVDSVNTAYTITDMSQICFSRSYDIAKLVNKYKTQDLTAAFSEGAITGVAGFVGIPFNLVLSTFLFFRAVQSIAMFYGYDVKNDSEEMIIASEVFSNALNPQSTLNNEGVSSIVVKIMAMAQADAIKQVAKKSWTDIALKNNMGLLLAQMRALANKSAKKALEKAGKKGLENTIFREVFEQIGKKLTQKTIQRAVPILSAGIGALIDTAQMNAVLNYADLFYRKRFILEKESRINTYLSTNSIIEVESI